jgi:hypothetical protein
MAVISVPGYRRLSDFPLAAGTQACELGLFDLHFPPSTNRGPVMTKQRHPSPIKRRNLAALNPLMRKSHAHSVSRKAQRRRDKELLRKGEGNYQGSALAVSR